MTLTVVALGIAVTYVSAQALTFTYPANCAPPNTLQNASGLTGPAPPLPVIPKTFQTRIEANLIDVGRTTVGEEYIDDANNRAVLRTIVNNSMDYIIFDYSINKIATVVNGICNVTDLALDPNQELFGLARGPHGMPHIYTTSGALHFAKSNGLTYMGGTTVRGISVDHWQSCMYWPILAANFTLDYYFTARNWTDPVLYPQVPVRAEIKGLQVIKSFHHIYEYYDFRTSIWADQSIFRVPVGIACPGLDYPSNCAQPNQIQAVTGTAPPLPVLPATFQAKVEANIINKNQTIFAEEYYDANGNRAAVKTIQNNVESYLILDYNDNQIFAVSNGVCNVTNLELDPNQKLFGLKIGTGGMPHVYTTNGALHFAQSNGLTYIGQTTVRGIAVDHWQSCVYWPELIANFTLDYYFSVYNWTDPVLYPQIPVRAEIVGSNLGVASTYFHHIYEYFDFRTSIWKGAIEFETPAGTVCPGRKRTKPVPQLAGQYSYREEIVNTMASQVSMADVWYDFNYKLVRFDYRPAYANPPYYTTNPVTEIHDYKAGVAYAIDRTLGNCSIIPIYNASFDAALSISKSINNNKTQFVIRMKSPSQLFYLDNTTYTYEGQRTVRDMLCDTYVSKRTDFSLPGYQTFNSTFVFYFLASGWTSSNNVGRVNAMNQHIPVRLDISTDSWVGYQASYNLYNFDEEDPSANTFDVTSCFDDFSQQPLILEFAGNYDSSLYQYKNNFLTATVDTLMAVTHLPRVRIQKAEFHIEPDNAYFVGTLMNVPPALSFYQKIPGVYKQYSNDQYITVTDAVSCAVACNSDQYQPCNSFEYCPGQQLCTLSKHHASDGTTIPNTGTCDFYARTINSTEYNIPLGQAWRLLKNIVIVGDLRINVNINGKSQQYTATSVDQNVIQNGQRQLSTQQALQNYNVQINKAIPGYDDLILTGQAVDDCATSCKNQEEWICNSFEYCFDTGYCVLSKIHPDERPGLVVNKALCDLYSRSYTSDYEMKKGLTVLSSSNAIYQNIYTADECGKLCNNYNAFSCKSFDYCDDLSTCYLGKTHFYDVPKANRQLTPSCNHYSRNYVYDFKKTQRKTIANRDDRVIAGISVTQCAKLCVEEETFNCASFDYCGNVTECRLSTASMKNIGQISVTPSLYCDVYNRETFPDGTAYVNNPQKYYGTPPPTTAAGTYSGGAMAGIGFGMLIVGFVLAVVLYIVVSKVRGKPLDNMTISFVKEQEANS